MENNSQDRDVHKNSIRKPEPEEQGRGGGEDGGMSSGYILIESLVQVHKPIARWLQWLPSNM